MIPEEQNKLARRAQSGDKIAYEELYDTFIRPIYNFIYYKTHHKETAEDLTSLTFTKALSNIQSFNADRGSFSSWLYQIARNTVVDHYRSQKTTLNIEDAWDLDDNSNLARDLENREMLQKVQAYLRNLPSDQRDIVIMRVWQELSYAEIAAALGKSEASCKMMFGRTIKQLRISMPVLILLGMLLLKK